MQQNIITEKVINLMFAYVIVNKICFKVHWSPKKLYKSLSACLEKACRMLANVLLKALDEENFEKKCILIFGA